MNRRTSKALSYAFGHHVFEQAAVLGARCESYRAITPSFVSPAVIRFAERLVPSVGRRLAGRSHRAASATFFKSYPIEHVYQFCASLRGRPFSYFRAHDRMARRITRDFEAPMVLIAVDTGAEALFRAWEGRTFRILDLTIAAPQYRAEIYRRAEEHAWNSGVVFHYPGTWELTRYAAELAMADLVLCPSPFVMDSCRFVGVPEQRLRLVPYGFDSQRFHPRGRSQPTDSAFRIVFVGTFCHRKGSHILLEAFARVRAERPRAELHVFGKITTPPASTPAGVRLHGHVSQEELAEELRAMDVMAFPTFFEGSAYSVYQALASGVPVLTTPNCGSVVDESCGRILDENSPEALAAALLQLTDDRPRLAALAAAAPAAVAPYTWANYGRRLVQVLDEAVPGWNQ